MGKKINLVAGQKFGRLTIIRENGRAKDKRVKWLCKCDCGKITIVHSSHLLNGHTKSCGCLQKKRASETKKNDLVDKKFGKLIVIKENGRINGYVGWLCQCICGKTITVSSNHLQKGNTKSCGCEISRGNNKIAEILTSLGVVFEQEKRFNNCRNIRSLPFDFWLPNYNILIEYQGRQHFNCSHWSKNKEKNEMEFKRLQYNDQLKREYCIQNNIYLVEISHKYYNKIPNILDKITDII